MHDPLLEVYWCEVHGEGGGGSAVAGYFFSLRVERLFTYKPMRLYLIMACVVIFAWVQEEEAVEVLTLF